MSSLSGGGQPTLFTEPLEAKTEEVTRTVDKIRDRFGSEAIGRLGARYS
jgi:hypothetical protein